MVNFQALSFFWLKRISEQEEEGKGFFWEINLIEQKLIKKKKNWWKLRWTEFDILRDENLVKP